MTLEITLGTEFNALFPRKFLHLGACSFYIPSGIFRAAKPLVFATVLYPSFMHGSNTAE